ncbi:unnamed protein product [Arctogadus glacialis]
MLDVFPLLYGFLVPQCLHTVTVLSTNLFPSEFNLTGKPKCSQTGDLNVGRSSSSVPPLAMTTLCCRFFFMLAIAMSASYVLRLCGNLGDRFVWQREYMETDVALEAAVIVTVVTEV